MALPAARSFSPLISARRKRAETIPRSPGAQSPRTPIHRKGTFEEYHFRLGAPAAAGDSELAVHHTASGRPRKSSPPSLLLARSFSLAFLLSRKYYNTKRLFFQMIFQCVYPIIFNLVAFELLGQEPFQIRPVAGENLLYFLAVMFAEVHSSEKGWM